MAATATPEAERLVDELVKRLGDGPITARDLAAELLADDAPVELIGALDEALSRAAAADEIDETLWGPTPSDEQLAKARRVARESRDEALVAALDGALTREQAAARLGVTPQAVSKRIAAGKMVALRRGRSRWLPAWQFHEDDVLPGLAELIDAYPGTALALTIWATSPSADLDDRTPVQVLTRRGSVEQVLSAARALTSAAW